MSADRNSQRIVLAGASSLLGSEVKSLLEESRFAGWDLRLVDEDEAAGILTEAGGEAALIQRVEEGTFRGLRSWRARGDLGSNVWPRPGKPEQR